MIKSLKTQLGTALAACMLLAGASAQAAAINFSVSPVSFTPGAGYGTDANEIGGTLLGAQFAAATGFNSFSLNAVGDSSSFNFGTITLLESGLINANEVDDLGISASFAFLNPLVGFRSLTATGTATTGLLIDVDIDLAIDWSPTLVAFGDGGLFRVDLDSQNFRFSGQEKSVTATITLLRAPNAVPEPASLALVGLALTGLALARRRG